jgi:5-methyltetrahydropteroyltriglutamate--homocysteine methyltransferase
MTAGDGRIRTTHVGSLVRPDELVAYLRKIDAGQEYDEEAYEDGEFGKSAWNYYVYERLGGIELRPSAPGDANFASVNDAPTDWTRFPEFYADYFAHEQEFESPGGDWACVAPVTYTGGQVIARDIANLRAAMDAAGVQEGFLPVVAPASCFPNLIDEHYGSEQAALLGIAEALAEEYRAIVDAGLYLQIDDAYIPFMYDVLVPPGTMGVISHATNVVEHPELVAERLERTARLVGADRVVASTDCGFAQGPYIQRVHPTIQWAKLRSLADGAKLASRAMSVAR